MEIHLADFLNDFFMDRVNVPVAAGVLVTSGWCVAILWGIINQIWPDKKVRG